MRNRFAAKIYWLPYEKGGRKGIPVSEKYAPIVIVKQDNVNPKEHWSIFVYNISILSKTDSLAIIEYLSDNAPDNLAKDVEFKLFEGAKLVAEGIVLQKID